MRSPTSSTIVLALALATLDCHGGLALAGGRHASFGNATLITEYRQDRRTETKLALVHVLFVPERDAPLGGGFTSGTSSSGTPGVHELEYQYSEMKSAFSLASKPVTIRGAESVEASGKTFSVERGNLFIALVRSDGSVRLTQLPRFVKDAEASPESIFEIMKAMVPGDARIQALARG